MQCCECLPAWQDDPFRPGCTFSPVLCELFPLGCRAAVAVTPWQDDLFRPRYRAQSCVSPFPSGAGLLWLSHRGSVTTRLLAALQLQCPRFWPAELSLPGWSLSTSPEPCWVRTALLLWRKASHCFIGTLGFGVAGINCFILLNDQVTTCCYYRQNMSPPSKPLKYSFKLKSQEVPTAFS